MRTVPLLTCYIYITLFESGVITSKIYDTEYLFALDKNSLCSMGYKALTLKFEKGAPITAAGHTFTSELLGLCLFVPRSDRRASPPPGRSLGEW